MVIEVPRLPTTEPHLPTFCAVTRVTSNLIVDRQGQDGSTSSWTKFSLKFPVTPHNLNPNHLHIG